MCRYTIISFEKINAPGHKACKEQGLSVKFMDKDMVDDGEVIP
jgi:hypothetical protein